MFTDMIAVKLQSSVIHFYLSWLNLETSNIIERQNTTELFGQINIFHLISLITCFWLHLLWMHLAMDVDQINGLGGEKMKAADKYLCACVYVSEWVKNMCSIMFCVKMEVEEWRVN